MTPETNILDTEYNTDSEPYTTYKMNMESLTIEGLCDGKEALKQAIYKLIMTERDAFLIYDHKYGIKLVDLYGKNMAYASAVIKLRLEDCFKNDSRIKGIDSLLLSSDKNKLVLTFTVNTEFGTIDFEQDI